MRYSLLTGKGFSYSGASVVARPSGPHVIGGKGVESPNTDRKVLLFEGDASIALVVERELRRSNRTLTLRTVGSPDEFLNELLGFDPTVVLLDARPPGLDPMAALSIVRERAPSAVFVVLTDVAGESVALECLKAGASEYVTTEHLVRLNSAIEAALEKRRTQEETQRAERGLRESEQKHRLVLESIDEIVYRVSTAQEYPFRGLVEFVSGRVRDIIGYTPDEFMTDPNLWINLVHPDDIPVLTESTMRIVQSRKPGLREYRLRHKESGEYRWVEDRVIPEVGEDGRLTGLLGVARDITDRRRLEDQLRQSQKMEAIGVLAGGVAHDFNNLISVILGYSELGLARLPPDQPARACLQNVIAAGSRAAELTRKLLAFSRQQVLQTRPFHINDRLDSFAMMLTRILGEDIEVTITKTPGSTLVNADESQIDQVLSNLCTNARQAMPRGGRLTMTTSRVVLDEAGLTVYPWVRPGEFVEVTIADSGIGMNEQVRARVFEPFFTTKEVGTGLGLAMAYGIVQQHGGFISVQSRLEQGTTFHVYLPFATHVTRVDRANPPGPIRGGTETLMLVEDDLQVRELACSILANLGYTVIAAEDGVQAVRLFEDRKGQIELVVMDVVMPKLGGYEAYQMLRSMNPAVKVLFTSGYAAQSVHVNFVLKEGLNLLQKPYRPADLAIRVREAIDAR